MFQTSFLGPRAAAQLVAMGDMHIPAVRTLLEQAAAKGVRNPEVYLALTKIYSEDVRRIEEAVRLTQKAAAPAVPSPRVVDAPSEIEFAGYVYAQGADHNVRYQLLSDSESAPRVTALVPPYYPPDLLDEKLSGEVVLDVQITEEGKVGGVWLVSAMPEIFGNLATASVRQWQFDPVPAKIRLILQFNP